MAKIQNISLRKDINEDFTIYLDWDNDRHHAIKLLYGSPQDVIDTLQIAILLLNRDIKDNYI